LLKLSNLFLLCCFSLVFLSCTQENPVVIKVGEQKWKSLDVENYFRFRLKALSLEHQNLHHLKKEFINEIILRSLIENWAYRNKIKLENQPLTKEEKKGFSKQASLFKSLKSHKNYLALYDLLLKNFIKKIPKPSFKEQQKFYKQNVQLFTKPASCQLKQIVVKQKSFIQVLKKRLAKGESFDSLSRNYSIKKHPGWVNKGDLEIFDRACFKLNPSPILKSPYGYHLFQIVAKKKAQKKSFKEVQASIIQTLKSKKAKEQFQKWLKQELFNTTVWTNTKFIDKIRIQYKR